MFYVAYLHSTLFHVLATLNLAMAQEASRPIKVPPKLAGNWIFSTVPVPGEKAPLQLAALPASTALKLEDGKKVAPYLVIYCQLGAARPLNAFLDMRLPISLDGTVLVKLNGKEFPAFPLTPLRQGDASRINLPRDLTPLLREAVELELQLPGHTVSFVLLNWQKIRSRLESSCE